MEPSSTVGERWRFCTSCLIGCIFLLFFLNTGLDRFNLSPLRNIAISLTSSAEFPTSSLQFSKPIKEKEEKKCNLLNGKWVYDPKASPLYHQSQCPFLSDQVSCQRNGRPDSDYEKWSWEAKECKIPRFNGTDMLEKLRGKRVIIVGDSLNRNQWESLACLLYSSIPSSRADVDERSTRIKIFRAKDYNCSVEFYWSPFIVELEENKANGSRILRLDTVSASSQKWKGADVMIFNTGHWWVHRGKIKGWDLFQYDGKLVEDLEIETAFQMGMKTWADWIDHNIDMNKTSVFFRSISPEHKGKQWCYNSTEIIKDESYIAIFPKQFIEIVESTIKGMRAPVKYMNITKLSQYRGDAHPSVYTSKQGKLLTAKQRMQPKPYADCSHWCLPGLPDTWNRLVYASMVLDNSRNIFSS